jgi:hypothetical protein
MKGTRAVNQGLRPHKPLMRPLPWDAGARGSLTGWAAIALLAWAAALLLLLCSAVLFATYAADAVRAPFGLDYSEGLIWQQALWLGGPHMYADISHYPFLVFGYPPLYLLAVRLLAATGLDMLLAGRLIALASTLATAWLIGLLVRSLTAGFGRAPSRAAAILAALLPFTLLPVIAWAPLMRVDMLALALTYGGLVLAASSLRRPYRLTASILVFVAACYTKQTFVAAPLAVLAAAALRSPVRAARAGLAGLLVGLAILAWLSAITGGGFLRHVFTYNVNRYSLAVAAAQSAQFLAAYAVFALLAAASLLVMVRSARAAAHPADRLWHRLRTNDQAWRAAFVGIYALLVTAMLALAGKQGASINYFLEFACLCCVLIGWLAAWCLHHLPPSRPLACCLPLCLVLQIWHLPADLRLLHAAQLSPARRAAAQRLLARVRAIPGPLLSDDMVLTLRAGKEVGLEPNILAELALAGHWREQNLIDMLRTHRFGAVVTAYGPGDPTFDARYLPRTQAAMLAAYPHVETYGDYTLRLP